MKKHQKGRELSLAMFAPDGIEHLKYLWLRTSMIRPLTCGVWAAASMSFWVARLKFRKNLKLFQTLLDVNSTATFCFVLKVASHFLHTPIMTMMSISRLKPVIYFIIICIFSKILMIKISRSSPPMTRKNMLRNFWGPKIRKTIRMTTLNRTLIVWTKFIKVIRSATDLKKFSATSCSSTHTSDGRPKNALAMKCFRKCVTWISSNLQNPKSNSRSIKMEHLITKLNSKKHCLPNKTSSPLFCKKLKYLTKRKVKLNEESETKGFTK